LGAGEIFAATNILPACSRAVGAASIGQPELARGHPNTMPAGESSLFLDFLAGFRFRQLYMSNAYTFSGG
jgi:hypothetical protein